MKIILLDPRDARAVDAVVDLLRAAHEADQPSGPPFSPAEARGGITHPLPEEDVEHWLAVADGTLVGVLALGFPRLDNTGTVCCHITVHPGARRTGVGRALHGRLVGRMGEEGRKLATCFLRVTGPAEAFARAIGAHLGVAVLRNRLEVDAAALDVAARVRTPEPGYEIRTFTGDVPGPWVDDVAALHTRLAFDVPRDDLEEEPEVFDAARVRGREAAFAAWGWRRYTAVATHLASGRLAGLSDLRFAEDPHTAVVGDTVVDPDHRGHCLGAALKGELLLFVRAHEPAVRAVYTWNAESNRPMLAVNAALGYRPYDRSAGWQLRL